jgi:hypothetical protein
MVFVALLLAAVGLSAAGRALEPRPPASSIRAPGR